ncbi:MAG TPA: cation transporter, partial [Pseudomonas sp.]|nr:cation transporter [Pseudomonas sp.]
DAHDLHVWGMSSAEIALTAHLSVGGDTDRDALLRAATQGLHEQFAIAHSTIQLEHDSGCQLSCSR